MSITQITNGFSNNLKASFINKQISTNVTYTYVQSFKDIIGIRTLLEENLRPYVGLKAQNSTYSIADAVNFMVDVVFQGYSRFSYMGVEEGSGISVNLWRCSPKRKGLP